jgi:hypothetical protein
VLNGHQRQPCTKDDISLCLGQVSHRLHVLARHVSNTKFKPPCFRNFANAAIEHRVGIEPVHSRRRSDNSTRKRHLGFFREHIRAAWTHLVERGAVGCTAPKTNQLRVIISMSGFGDEAEIDVQKGFLVSDPKLTLECALIPLAEPIDDPECC